jgi:hypothetical protein
MRRRLGSLPHGRAIAALVAVAALGAVVYLLFLRGGETTQPKAKAPVATSVIGVGEDAVGVSAEGRLLTSLPPPPDGRLPTLPLDEPPDGGQLAGPALEQARVLGAAPAALRPCIAGSRHGETGVDVILRSGIELRFGDATRADEKWRSAVAVLADPSITAADYVDLHSPARPAVYGEGHALPAPEGGAAGRCGE